MGNSHHEHLSPSASNRWMNCPFSVVYDNTYKIINNKKPYLDSSRIRGDEAHARAATVLQKWSDKNLRNKTEALKNAYSQIEDDREISGYVKYVINRYVNLQEKYSDSIIRIESMVDCSSYAENCYGTADAFLVGGTELIVVDFKSGEKRVHACKNTQLMIYALAVYEAYKEFYPAIENIEVVIYQPKQLGEDKWIISLSELLEWGNSILRPAAERALDPYCRSREPGQWCEYCNGKDHCTENASRLYGYEGCGESISKQEMLRLRNIAIHASELQSEIERLKLNDFPVLRTVTETINLVKYFEEELKSTIAQTKLYNILSRQPLNGKERQLTAIDLKTNSLTSLTSIAGFREIFEDCCVNRKKRLFVIRDNQNNTCILCNVKNWTKAMEKQLEKNERYFVNHTSFWSSQSDKTYFLVDGDNLSDYKLFANQIHQYLTELEEINRYNSELLDILEKVMDARNDDGLESGIQGSPNLSRKKVLWNKVCLCFKKSRNNE